MAVLAAIALNITGLSVRVELSASTLVIISGYAALAIYCRFVRQNVEVARALIGFGQLVSVIVLGIMLNYAVSTVALPFRDAELYAIDRWLGFERESYIAFLGGSTMACSNFSTAPTVHCCFKIFSCCSRTIIARRIDRLQMYIVAFAIAVTATAAIVIFIPAASAMIYVDKVPLDISTLSDGGHNHYPVLAGLRNGTLRVVDFSCVEGLITFPSFHTANALLFVWALWPVRSSLRLILVPLNLLLIASTPLFRCALCDGHRWRCCCDFRSCCCSELARSQDICERASCRSHYSVPGRKSGQPVTICPLARDFLGNSEFDPQNVDDRTLLDSITSADHASANMIEGCPDLVARTADRMPVTDDNMGTEWRYNLGFD